MAKSRLASCSAAGSWGADRDADVASCEGPNILTDRFGLLLHSSPFMVGDLAVAPLPVYAEAVAWLEKHQHRDGYLYPPPSRTMELDRRTLRPRVEIPNTQRPAFLWKLPASHSVTTDAAVDQVTFRRDTGLFVLSLIAYLFGTRLQFHDWWVDARVATKPQANLWDLAVVTPFLTTAYRTWRSWPEPDRIAMAGLLAMHARVPGYEWVWERFTFEYMVFDSLYSLAATRMSQAGAVGHGKRMARVCEHFGIPTDTTKIRKIVALRNDLFHEVTFGSDPPGFSGHGDVFILPFDLRALNRRVIAALLGWDTPFVRSPWWLLNRGSFE